MSQGHFGNLCDTDNFGDPVVLYDSFEDRWVITDFAFKLDGSGNVNPQHSFQCFAVSKTGDPVNGGWNFYSIETPGGLGDYPKFGVWPDGIYMSANMFGYAAGASYIAPHVWALNKQQMYNGDPNPQVVDFTGPSADFTVIPANARLQTGTPPPGTPEYFTATEEFLNAQTVYKFHVDWDKISTSTFTGPDVPLAPTCWPAATPANASTPANAADVLAIRAMAQTQYTNIGGAESLWMDHTVDRGEIPTASCGATTPGNAATRWYQINVTGGTVAANDVQGHTYDPDGANTFFRFMPALAVDRVGDMAVGYTKSNSTTNPQIKYAGRLASDPINTFSQDEQTLINGTGAQSGNCGPSTCVRWGDYSGMALDPNGCEFWETGEYYATTGLNHQTRIGSFHFPGCTTVGNGTLSGTVTDGSEPDLRRDRQPRQPDGDDERERRVLVHRPGRHVSDRDGGQAGLQPRLGRDARRPERRHAHEELRAHRVGPERLLHRQLAEHVPARRAERVRPRGEPGQRAAQGGDRDQPDEHDGHEQRLRREQHCAGPGRRSPRRSPGRSPRSTSTSSARAARARRRTSPCRSAPRPARGRCRRAPTSPLRRSPASTAAPAASSLRRSPARRR